MQVTSDWQPESLGTQATCSIMGLNRGCILHNFGLDPRLLSEQHQRILQYPFLYERIRLEAYVRLRQVFLHPLPTCA